MLWQGAAGSEPAAPLAHIGEAKDRIHQIIVGRELQCVDAGVAKSHAQLGLSLRRGGREAPAKRPIAGIDVQLLAGLGVLDDDQTEVGRSISDCRTGARR
jgi:hypothetical protein